MRAKRFATNPFYVLLVISGMAFALTACAYTVMAFKAARPRPAPEAAGGAALLDFLNRHGAELMGGELVLLAVATVAAISTDRYWMRREVDDHRAQRPPTEMP